MSSNDVRTRPADHGAIRLELTGGGALASSLVVSVNEFCDQVEDAVSGGDRPLGVVLISPGTGPEPEEVGIRLVNRWERVLRRVERLGAVTIAVVERDCAGPAVELLLATDYRLGAANANLALPVGTGQFWPGMVLHRLANQLGVSRTRQLLLRSPELPAARAAELGLLDEITEDLAGSLAAAVESFRTVDGPEFAVRRRLLLDAPTTTFEDALGVHLAACDRSLRRAAKDVADSAAMATL
ncbi:enoyl-CoA-hydratase DpgB [Amycolatopsis anabasis]|uniref:enoyl-CoA-hydratase DpgB n=1 Tax=Amycolatopsis anabasis TaxID=1840409 RepID=UPI00131BF729|nr:enoyl-CoA-hydratase DpgB [Amycolatopsis anabasis]